MEQDGLHIIVTRQRRSRDYKLDPKADNSFGNNRKNNGIDKLAVYNGKEYLQEFNCHSISNHPNPRYKYGDSLAPGTFKVRAFVEPRKFHGRPHGIVDGVDLEGQPIGQDSMQLDNGYQSGRWLIHDKYSFTEAKDTTFAWSGGCIIMTSHDLDQFGNLLESHGVKPGDLIQAYLVEV